MKRKILQVVIIALFFITATISCKRDEPLSGLTLDQTLIIGVGETVTLTVTFIPEDATNKNVSWESSDPTIATVDNGKVTGIAVGVAKITVIAQDQSRTAQCMVSVSQPIEPEMVWVEGGTFTMGCTDDECKNNESPAHSVTVSSFYIGKYVVTQKEWIAAMGNNPSAILGDSIAVHGIIWSDAQKYITVLNAISGKNYRLPTEAEWEYAARGGNDSHGYKYSGSDNIDEVAWYLGNANTLFPVGTKKPNELGIYDMSGSVWEWCSDWYSKYSNSPQINPTGPGGGTKRVVRNGSWNNDAEMARIACRDSISQGFSIYYGGFRLVLPVEQKKD